MNRLIALCTVTAIAAACSKDESPHGAEHAPTPTNRIDTPDAVRRNLGLTFATVTLRPVSGAVILPGVVDAIPGSMIDCSVPVAGIAMPLVQDLQSVTAGTPLVRIESDEWRGLLASLTASRAACDAQATRRDACRAQAKAAGEGVALWTARLAQLERVREAGAASAPQLNEARAALQAQHAAQAEALANEAVAATDLADALARRAAVEARVDAIATWAGTTGTTPSNAPEPLVLRASRDGVVMLERDAFGRRIEPGEHLLRMVDPTALEVRASALPGDHAALRGCSVALADPIGAFTGKGLTSLRGPVAIAPAIDPVSRSSPVVMRPERLEPWAAVGMPVRVSILTGSEAPQLAVPARAIVRDGTVAVLFRRDPKAPDRVIRLEADLGPSDGAWTVVRSGVREGDEVVLEGAYQLMLATSGSAPRGGHFHADGTFHEGED